MAWYKTGIIAATNGSTAIIGSETKFVSNARVGDGFRGPDGAWYEIVNIASETSLGIFPAYAGPTIVTSNYMIAPIQGYNKESSDRLRAITDSFPATFDSKQSLNGNLTALSVLSGASNRLPYFNSQTTMALTTLSDKAKLILAAETNTAIQTEIGLSPVSSVTDATAGRVVTVGWQGFGGTQRLIPNTDFNNLPTMSINFIGQSTTNGPETGDFYVEYYFLDNNNANVKATSVTSGNEYFRTKVGSWGTWKKVITQENTVGNLSSGSVIEKGSNASGSYVRFADGTLICTSPVNSRTVDISVPNGSGGFNSLQQPRTTHPYPFIDIPFQDISVTSLTDSAIWYGSGDAGTASEFKRYYLFGFTAGSRTIETRTLAIGRWKN